MKHTYYISTEIPAYGSSHNAFGQGTPRSNCLVCFKPISIDISYFWIEKAIGPKEYETKFVGRVCSSECGNFYVLSKV